MVSQLVLKLFHVDSGRADEGHQSADALGILAQDRCHPFYLHTASHLGTVYGLCFSCRGLHFPRLYVKLSQTMVRHQGISGPHNDSRGLDEGF